MYNTAICRYIDGPGLVARSPPTRSWYMELRPAPPVVLEGALYRIVWYRIV